MSQDNSPSLRILVADDNVDSTESLSILLEMVGHTVQVVHDGPGALQAAEEFNPHVILLDIGLPSMDGYEVARRLREDGGERRLRTVLIAVTGYSQSEDIDQAKAAGFNHHLVKPVDPEVLLSLIESSTT